MPFADLEELRVYYEEDGGGEPVLLINGLGADHTAWAVVIGKPARHVPKAQALEHVFGYTVVNDITAPQF